MALCKGIVEEVENVSKIIDFKVKKEMAGRIAEKTEDFLTQLLEKAAEVCRDDKRKIVTADDLKSVIYEKKLDVLMPLFD